MKIFFIPFHKRTFIFISIIILIIILFITLLLTKGSMASFSSQQPIYEVETGRKEIALTCNVVWGTEYLPPILDILEEEQVKMTFFIGGKWAEDNPELLQSIYSHGHEIGNHGYDHKKHSQLSDIENENEITQAEKSIENILGIKTTLFAPPYGDINDKTVEIAENLGYKVIMWNIDTIDWRDKDPQVLYDRVVQKKLDGGIVLMHPTEGTVKALPSIIKEIKNQQVNMVTVSDLIKE